MKRRFTILTAALALLAFLAIPMGMWGQTSVTWPGTTALPGTATAVANDQNVTIMVSSTNTYSNPIRIYANTTVTINALNGAKILSVAYEASSTGNYVTNAQNATVTPNVTPTVSGKIVTWTYTESENVTEFTFTPSAQTRSNGISITYKTSGGSEPTIVIPEEQLSLSYEANENGSFSVSFTNGFVPNAIVPTLYSDADCQNQFPTSGDGAWIVLTTTDQSTINYSVAANNSSAERTVYLKVNATDYNNGDPVSITNVFTVTQAANPNGPGSQANPYTVAQARAAIDANAGTQNVYATGIVSAIPTAYNSTYGNITFNMVDEEGDEVFLQAYRCGGDEAANVTVGDVVVVYGNLTKYGQTYEFGQGCQLVSLTHQESTEPSITFGSDEVDLAAEMQTIQIPFTYENIVVTGYQSFTVHHYDADGEEIQPDPDTPWYILGVTGSNDEGYKLSVFVSANEGEARSAYLKVSALDAENNTVYSNLVTINQEAYVAPTYAELPFAFNGGRDDIETTDGLYQEGLGTDYNATNNPNTKLKFDGTGDWLLLQFNERPGTLTFDIKGNSFSGGTFKVQTSADGVSYSDLETYTTFGNNETFEEVFNNLDENVRYIKWIYTTKASGNVGLGNIALAEYAEEVHTITVSPELIEVGAEGGEGGLEYIVNWDNGGWAEGFQFYDAEGETVDQPDWITIVYQIGENEDYHYTIAPNTGDARTAYFKAYTDDEGATVYSNLVTVNQAEYTEPVHTITVSPELIEVDAEGGEGGLEYIVNWDNGDWAEGFQFYDAEGETVDQPDWITIVYQIGENEDYHYTIAPNTGDARTAYFKAYTDDEGTMIYSNLVTVNQAAPVTPVTDNKYVKVTSNADLTSGQYLIIYDEGSVAFNGGLETLDAVSNTIGVTIQNDEISMTAETAAAEFTIDMTAGTIKSASGYYIGQTSDANGMQASAETAYTNTISIVNEGDANIVSSGGAYLRFNSASNQNRFRYYKSSSYTAQKAIQLYKKVGDEPATETCTLTIDGYAEGNVGGYHLIASPVTVDPSTNGMTEGNFDLYYFNQAEQDEWRNWKEEDGGHFNLVPGTGYLYAKQATTDNEVFQFTLTGTPYEGYGTVMLTKLEGVDWSGLNLVGNPFNEMAYIDREFYTMNDDGSAIIPATNNSIQAMEGIFVYAGTNGEEMQFSTEVPAEPDEKIIMNVTRNRGNVVDRAIVRFSQGGVLPKFQLNPNSTKLYMTEGNQEFAVVRSANEGELPVSFKASENGNYTLNIETENVEVSYLHLIDNKTGVDTDLLATPSYTFEANTTDYANRFKLVFTTGSSTGSDTFAYFNGNEWVINNEGEATLQVVDVTGRVLSSEQINGSYNNSLNLSAGVYVLRLNNGNTVKTQKIVID